MARIRRTYISYWTIFLVVHLGYTASAQINPASTSSVRLPPAITLNPAPNIIYTSGSAQGQIECGAIGTPTPVYTWTWNGSPLSIDGTHIVLKSQGTIVINSPDDYDQGYYQCTATNTWGTSLSIVSFFQMAYLNSYSSPNTGGYTASVGQPMQFPCDPPTSVPNATYSWVTAPSINSNALTPVALSKRISVDLSDSVVVPPGSLLFANVITGDSSTSGRVYKCQVYNAFTKTTNVGSPASLTVNAATPSNIAPVIVKVTSSPKNAVVGQTIIIFCAFKGYPTPTIAWSTSSPSNRYTLSEFNNTLTITNVQQSDQMSYTCQGSNSAGSATSQIQVTVSIPPYFQSAADQLTNVNATNGQSISFICKTATSDPPSKTVWYKNSISFTTSNLPSNYILSDDQTNLTISDVCKECPDGNSDLAVIQCNVSNSNGYAFAQGYLNVLDATSITSTQVDQTLGSSSEIVFYCSATSDPSTPVNITWLFNNQKITYSNNIYTDSSGNLHINTNGAPNGGSSYAGLYTCVATNGYSTATQYMELSAPSRRDIAWWLKYLKNKRSDRQISNDQ